MTPEQVKAWDDFIRNWNTQEPMRPLPPFRDIDKPRLTAKDIIFLREVGIQL